MMQLVVWIVLATANPASSNHNVGARRFVAAYTTEVECQKHARSVNDEQQRSFSKTPELIYEIYSCQEVVVKTECHNYTDGRC